MFSPFSDTSLVLLLFFFLTVLVTIHTYRQVTMMVMDSVIERCHTGLLDVGNF